MDDLLTNPDLIKYWNQFMGGNKTVLTITNIMDLAIHVTAFEVLPRSMSAIYWNDGFATLEMDGK
ncbi:TPA: DUF2163 domain-containing protein, partial [Enterobacter cloacae]